MTESLIVLWNQGHATLDIAKKLSVLYRDVAPKPFTSNSVIGKARRLCLTKRKSTLKSRYCSKNRVREPETVKVSDHSLQEDKRLKIEEDALDPLPFEHSLSDAQEGSHVVRAVLGLKANMCRYPIGSVKDDGFHFCGREKSLIGPYCDEHARVIRRTLSRRFLRAKEPDKGL